MSEQAQNFVTYLQRLGEGNRGTFAVLRRSLSFAPGTYPPAYPFVEPFVGADRHAQDSYRLALYVVAGLFALHPHHSSQSLARALGELMRIRDSDSIEKRFIALLGADAETLPDYLRQIISLLASADLAVDYVVLLNDLSAWLNPMLDPERRDRIRQRWARDFYTALAPRDRVEADVTTELTEISENL